MKKRIRNLVLATAAAVAVFAGGVALAGDGNYCEDIDSLDCVCVDVIVDEGCCKNLDGTGLRLWTCSRELFECYEGWEVYNALGGGYNCHSPGASCQ